MTLVYHKVVTKGILTISKSHFWNSHNILNGQVLELCEIYALSLQNLSNE